MRPGEGETPPARGAARGRRTAPARRRRCGICSGSWGRGRRGRCRATREARRAALSWRRRRTERPGRQRQWQRWKRSGVGRTRRCGRSPRGTPRVEQHRAQWAPAANYQREAQGGLQERWQHLQETLWELSRDLHLLKSAQQRSNGTWSGFKASCRSSRRSCRGLHKEGIPQAGGPPSLKQPRGREQGGSQQLPPPPDSHT